MDMEKEQQIQEGMLISKINYYKKNILHSNVGCSFYVKIVINVKLLVMSHVFTK